MKIQDFNTPATPSPDPASPAHSADPAAVPEPLAVAPVAGPSGTGAAQDIATEVELLKAQVRHLEAVVETARALLNSNQERLLRRLHEAPREQVALSLRLRNGTGH